MNDTVKCLANKYLTLEANEKNREEIRKAFENATHNNLIADSSFKEFVETNNKIILMIGRSGSGKTTISNILCEKYGLKSVESYTTRPKRSDDEKGHIFVTKEEFDKLDDKVAYTSYGGYEYCATRQQADECDIYVIDCDGIKSFFKNYRGNKQPYILFLDTSEEIAVERMRERGDSEESIQQRLQTDKQNHLPHWNGIIDTTKVSAESAADMIYTYVIQDIDDKALFSCIVEENTIRAVLQ
jgi:guanylate kinase